MEFELKNDILNNIHDGHVSFVFTYDPYGIEAVIYTSMKQLELRYIGIDTNKRRHGYLKLFLNSLISISQELNTSLIITHVFVFSKDLPKDYKVQCDGLYAPLYNYIVNSGKWQIIKQYTKDDIVLNDFQYNEN